MALNVNHAIPATRPKIAKVHAKPKPILVLTLQSWYIEKIPPVLVFVCLMAHSLDTMSWYGYYGFDAAAIRRNDRDNQEVSPSPPERPAAHCVIGSGHQAAGDAALPGNGLACPVRRLAV
ncbi:MAG TPA: hypothetical protein PLD10_03520 [Rhodopila sp.]|nr:hypothetical protein [Rhodopila sp.]